MKLRNKKTGEVVERTSIVTLRERRTSCSSSLVEAEDFSSIEQLNENWEDYKPTEPLIKDEKIRKVVRAWAKINTFEPGYSVMYDAGIFGLASCQADIEFNFPLKELKGGKYYTIEELCGEEEECRRVRQRRTKG